MTGERSDPEAAAAGAAPRDPAAAYASIADLVRERLDRLSASERKVARALLAAYPMAGLETVAALAQRASVSPPTVVRFVSHIGFPGHAAFQAALKRETFEQIGAPLAQFDRFREDSADGALDRTLASFVQRLGETFAEVPDSELTAAARLLCDSRRRVYLAGGQFSMHLSRYLAANLQILRPDVTDVSEDPAAQLSIAADASRMTTVVVFDYRRYEARTVRFAQDMAERGARIVLFTDSWLSPIADVAQIVLPSRVESLQPLYSLVPALALVEALIQRVWSELGDRARARLEMIEDLRSRSGPDPSSLI